ncbi:chaperone modulator CbpM [Pseudozobellia sp. WGM2]|uniref:chaperone modulator CbpM n=1 Tax=Pseudozobellia sp. WGM2 TaxID=2787625 RepID=UPI001ADF48AC|nr:chaperone modulator CbpM [Pseudozobellia sp. WGM2]
MNSDKYMLVRQFCEQTEIEISFIGILQEYNLIACIQIETETYIRRDDISEIERINRLYHELGINLEGIDALNYMLQRISKTESKMRLLRNKLSIYEK